MISTECGSTHTHTHILSKPGVQERFIEYLSQFYSTGFGFIKPVRSAYYPCQILLFVRFHCVCCWARAPISLILCFFFENMCMNTSKLLLICEGGEHNPNLQIFLSFVVGSLGCWLFLVGSLRFGRFFLTH